MATFQFDPELMNQSLQQYGSDYRAPASSAPTAPSYTQSLDSAAPAPAAPPPERASFQAPAAAAPVAQATDTEVPGSPPPATQAQAPKVVSGLEKMSSMGQVEPEKKVEGLQKLGSIVGSVMGMFTGNYGGAANSAAGL